MLGEVSERINGANGVEALDGVGDEVELDELGLVHAGGEGHAHGVHGA